MFNQEPFNFDEINFSNDEHLLYLPPVSQSQPTQYNNNFSAPPNIQFSAKKQDISEYLFLFEQKNQSSHSTNYTNISETNDAKCEEQPLLSSITEEETISNSSQKNNQQRLPPSIVSRQREQEILKNWKTEIDKHLPTLVIKNKQDWKKIAKFFSNTYGFKATPAFLKSYYKSFSTQGKFTEPTSFTKEMDLELVRLINIHGLKWAVIAHEMGQEDPIKLKNRYYHQIKKKNLFRPLLKEVQNRNNSFENFNLDLFPEIPEMEQDFSVEPFISSPNGSESRSQESGSQKQDVNFFAEKLTKCESLLSRFGEDFFEFNDQLDHTINDF